MGIIYSEDVLNEIYKETEHVLLMECGEENIMNLAAAHIINRASDDASMFNIIKAGIAFGRLLEKHFDEGKSPCRKLKN